MLKGKEVQLRPLTRDDIVTLNKWRNNLNNLILTQGYRLPVTLDRDIKWFENLLVADDNKNIYFAIESNTDKEFIGIIQLNNIDYTSQNAECGILLGKKSTRGKEYGVEAVRLVLKYSFSVLNLNKVITYLISKNSKAISVQNKVGKVHDEGRLHEHYYFNGKYYDILIRSFFKSDYTQLKIIDPF